MIECPHFSTLHQKTNRCQSLADQGSARIAPCSEILLHPTHPACGFTGTRPGPPSRLTQTRPPYRLSARSPPSRHRRAPFHDSARRGTGLPQRRPSGPARRSQGKYPGPAHRVSMHKARARPVCFPQLSLRAAHHPRACVTSFLHTRFALFSIMALLAQAGGHRRRTGWARDTLDSLPADPTPGEGRDPSLGWQRPALARALGFDFRARLARRLHKMFSEPVSAPMHARHDLDRLAGSRRWILPC